MYQVEDRGRYQAELLLIVGVVVQYIATRLALGGLGRADGSTAGRRALGQWLPIMSTALAAVALRQPAIAVGIVFGSSVACLSLVLGMTTYVAPLQELPPERRVWPLVLPAAVFVLLAGFHGSLTWLHAVMLLLMGAAFVPMWLDRTPGQAPAPVAPVEAPALGPWAIVLALVLAAYGAYASARGAERTSEQSRLLTGGLLAATVLSPLLVLPSLGSATMLGQRGHTGRAITALTGTVLLNLCALLPIIILIDYLLSGLGSPDWAMAVRQAIGSGSGATAFPLVTWRVDSVLLVVLGFALVPVSAARWLPERLEAVLLILIYAAYLAVETLLAARVLG